MAPDVRQRIEKIAARERRTLSNTTVILLDEALDQRERRSEALLRVEAARPTAMLDRTPPPGSLFYTYTINHISAPSSTSKPTGLGATARACTDPSHTQKKE